VPTWINFFSILKKKDLASTVRLTDSRVDTAFESIFKDLKSHCEKHGIKLLFRIRTERSEGISRTFRDALPVIAQLNYVSLDNPEFYNIRIVASDNLAEDAIQTSGIPEEYLEHLAREFVGNTH